MNFINGTDSLPAAKHNSALRKETPSSAVQPTAQPTKDVIRESQRERPLLPQPIQTHPPGPSRVQAQVKTPPSLESSYFSTVLTSTPSSDDSGNGSSTAREGSTEPEQEK
jgi:hypothetical protein